MSGLDHPSRAASLNAKTIATRPPTASRLPGTSSRAVADRG